MTSNLMQASNHWKGYQTTDDLENFRNNGGSAGLDGGSKVGGQIVNDDAERCIVYYHILKEILDPWFLETIWHNEKGKPTGPCVDGRILTRSDIQTAYNAWRLYPYLEDGMHIVEIGPGFGGLAAMLKRLFDVTIDLVDLPNQRQIQQYYLEEFDGISWKEPEELKKADVVINIRSMMEMNHGQVEGYFDLIYNVVKPDLFYCVNRYIKRTTLRNYPFKDNWEPLISTPLMFEPAVHELLLTPGSGIAKMLNDLPPYKVAIGPHKGLASIPVEMQTFEIYSQEQVNAAQKG